MLISLIGSLIYGQKIVMHTDEKFSAFKTFQMAPRVICRVFYFVYSYNRDTLAATSCVISSIR